MISVRPSRGAGNTCLGRYEVYIIFAYLHVNMFYVYMCIIMILNPTLCRAARVGIQMSRKELAEASGLNERTIIDFERGARTPHDNNLRSIKQSLENQGVVFKDGNCICLPLNEL